MKGDIQLLRYHEMIFVPPSLTPELSKLYINYHHSLAKTVNRLIL